MWPIPKKIVFRSCCIGLVVGSILALLNYGDKLVAWQMTSLDWCKLIMTYLVPFSVSSYASLSNKKPLPCCKSELQGRSIE